MTKGDAKIGIVAGAGPYAGLDLAQKILQQTSAKIDQDYLPTISISTPADIAASSPIFRKILARSSKGVVDQLIHASPAASMACFTSDSPA